MIDFPTITNQIAQLIKNDAELTLYCVNELGSALNGIDNPIYDDYYFPSYPNFIVGKEEESHYFNKAGSTDDTYVVNIMFTGKFVAPQTSQVLTLPVGAEQTINGILTYTPSDTMRKIANKVGKLVYQEIGCKIPGLLLLSFLVDADDYYSEENGTVSSIIRLELYENSSRVQN